MKSAINPKFERLSSILEKTAHGEHPVEKIFCDRRNRVELVKLDDMPVVVKRFRKVGVLRGLVYTFFRQPKAKRAFENALRLREEGIGTPEPLAWYAFSSFGIFREGVLITEYTPLPDAASVLFRQDPDSNADGWFRRNLSDFTLDLHRRGILPLDYNPSNILYEKTGEGYFDGCFRFSLIDINRMEFGRIPGIRKSMRAFLQLGTNIWNFHKMLHPYAEGRGWVMEDCLYTLLRIGRRWNRRKWFKDRFKK